ncbi:FAD-binding protein, partial [Thermodesulfobacteriota bacterium]
MQMSQTIKWDYEVDIAVVGYGGAGAITAITAHDLGAKILILEKQKQDTPDTINHTPNSRISGGFVLCATDAKKAADYLYWSSWGATPRDCCEVMGEYMVTNEEYMRSMGSSVERAKGYLRSCEFYDVAPGSDAIYVSLHKGRSPKQFQIFMDNINRRKIPVLYNCCGKELIQDQNTREVIGVVAESHEKKVYVKANKAVVLSTGGFEWDEEMKLNFLRAYPSYFYSNPANEGDGIKMGQKAGAALWHMNTISARVIPYIEDQKLAFGSVFNTPFILVNKYGKRFTTEPGETDPAKYRSHSFWLECVDFDTQKVEYPQVPCYQIFDETTRLKGPFARSFKKGLLPDGTIQYYYRWSKDNSEEIKKGWVIKANTIEELAENIAGQDSENDGKMDST